MTTDHEPIQTSEAIDSEDVASEAAETVGTEQMTAESGIPTSETNETTETTETTETPQADLAAADAPHELSSESRNWATFAHLSAFVMFLGIPSLIGPLVVWLAKKDDPYVEAQAKEALNFNISMLIYAIAAGISILLVIGIIALPAVFIAWFVLVIVAAIRSADGEEYRYPFTIRLVS